MTPTKYFDPRLEGLRGVASAAVVITHAVAVLKVDGLDAFWVIPISAQTPSSLALLLLTAVFNSYSAVVLFFVLSGLVLSISSEKSNLFAYFSRRAFRLLPPMWASIIFMALLLYLFPLVYSTNLSDWSRNVFVPPTLSKIANNLLLQSFQVNGVTWTMYVEVIGSAFIPLSLLVKGRNGLLLLALTAALAFFLYPSLTFSYIFCFQTGVLIARTKFSLQVGAAWLAPIMFFLDRFFFPQKGFMSLLFNCIASALLIAAVRQGAWESFLEKKLIRITGRCSYSLYLFHPLILFILAHFADRIGGNGLLPHVVILGLALPFSLLLSVAGYRLFEAPSITAGRAIAQRLQQVRAG
jgi:peptidoglycan/LPS O-acetylase OafA/YrhL